VHFKRVIPCLDVDAGRVVKGVEFLDIRDAGDPIELAAHYDREGADELVFLDITATHQKRDTIAELARRTADDVFVPFTIGGGVRSVADAQAVLDAGADKVSINSAALQRPGLIDELAEVFGAQCVVLAIDAKSQSDAPLASAADASVRSSGRNGETPADASEPQRDEVKATGMLGPASSNGCTMSPVSRWKRLISPHGTFHRPKERVSRSEAEASASRRCAGVVLFAM